MPRTLSDAARTSLFAAETDKVWLVLLTIDHVSLATPIRVVRDERDLVSRGNTFVGFPFDIDLPLDAAGQVSSVPLSIDNVDRTITDAIRAMGSDACSITLEVVVHDSPDVVEAGPFLMTMVEVDGDAMRITGTLSFENILAEPFPARSFTPASHPGLF